MERLVKNLLNLSSLEALRHLETVQVDISALLDDLMGNYQFLAEGNNIRIKKHIQPGLLLQGDEEKLRRAFSNVLDNAVKYNVEDGNGLVAVSAAEQGKMISIVVTNTGGRVPEEECEKIFEQFYRLEKSRSQEKGGFGLGLAIVKKTVELHGGTVSFWSEEENGETSNRVMIFFLKNMPRR